MPKHSSHPDSKPNYGRALDACRMIHAGYSRIGCVNMNNLLIGIVFTGLIIIPGMGQAATKGQPSPVAIAMDAADKAKASMQEGLAVLAAARKAADQAAENVSKARADLKAVETSGNKRKITEAASMLRLALKETEEATFRLNAEAALIDRLKVTFEKASMAADKAAKATSTEEAGAAATEAEKQAERAGKILESTRRVMEHRPPDEIIIRSPPPTTSTTQPSPTPIGRRG
jgi:hypothetical protein